MYNPHYPWTQPLNKKRSVKDWIGYFDPVEFTYIWGHITYKPDHNKDINTTFKVDYYIENQSEQFSLLPCLGCNKSESDTNNNISFEIPQKSKINFGNMYNPHYPWTQPLNKKRSVKDWIGYFDPVEFTYIWGHITYKPDHNKDINTTFKVDYYIENQSEQFSLLPCLGCNKSESDTNNNISCTFSTPSDLIPVAITGLMKLKGAQWKFKLPCNFSSIKNHIYNQYNTPIINLFPTIYLEFYSNGSLTEQGTQHMCMGSAWIQTSGPQLLSTFSCGVSSWPSSSHAEVIAIFTALLTAPSQCKVKINTDSQTFILFKVKAHSGVIFNEQVDRLAKNALNLEPIQFNIIGMSN
ncbi:hypothetical protein Glove_682g6 [Diversispora epigaea]|uniref:RNase H type-1 domain-containing protein n=1 Tax=Diversispora epigaea TaxID=1348612 RepID=A0A397G3U5_9GLOM|nr:hypothetical protein Glove_682g6 [Diversispora epigaea]